MYPITSRSPQIAILDCSTARRLAAHTLGKFSLAAPTKRRLLMHACALSRYHEGAGGYLEKQRRLVWASDVGFSVGAILLGKSIQTGHGIGPFMIIAIVSFLTHVRDSRRGVLGFEHCTVVACCLSRKTSAKSFYPCLSVAFLSIIEELLEFALRCRVDYLVFPYFPFGRSCESLLFIRTL